jgi:hypothetical protein
LKKLTTRAVYWEGDPTNFDVNKMEKKSSLAVIGADRNNVADFYYNEIDRWFAEKYLTNPSYFWDGGVGNPERSQNFKHSTTAGTARFIAIDGWALTGYGEGFLRPFSKLSPTQSGALLVMHGMGHNADMNCSDSNEVIHSKIMKYSEWISDEEKKAGYNALFLPEIVNGTDVYVKAIKTRYQ